MMSMRSGKSKAKRRWWTGKRFVFAGLITGFLVTMVVGVWVMSSNARFEINAMAVASTDSKQWSLAQTEVEFLQLYAALHGLLHVEKSLEESIRQARRRFDVFYSRVETIAGSKSFDEIRATPRVQMSLKRIEAFLTQSVPLIDAEDRQLFASAENLLKAAEVIAPDVRVVSLTGVGVFSQTSDHLRTRVSGALSDLGYMAFFLLAVLLTTLAVLLWSVASARRKAAAIRQTENRLQAIVSTSLDGILVVNRQGKVVDYNGAAQGIFGYKYEEVIGQDMGELIIPDHLRSAHNGGMAHYRETGEKRVAGAGLLQLEAKRKDGSVFPVELSINSAESDDEEIFVSYMRDISQRMADQQELVEARDQALAGEKAKAELLAVMSHEMRTPLNGVLGVLELLNETKLTNKQRSMVGLMETSGHVLLDQVNAVLDISRVDAGKTEINPHDFNLRLLAQETLDSLAPQAKQRANELRLGARVSKLGLVHGDSSLIRQILFNLLGNAIKFTENGDISLDIEMVESVSRGSDAQVAAHTPDQSYVEFRVRDTGVGIRDENLTRIFDDFITLDSSYNRTAGGTGLGLGIVKRLVALLKGRIGVESTFGQGSLFWFRLPLQTVAGSHAQPQALKAGKGDTNLNHMRILVVEDNEINQMVVCGMLENHDCTVAVASDGFEGVQLANDQPFDLILMDISMPKMDGLTATQKIKASDGANGKTPIVALTAHAMKDDLEKFTAAGMEEVLTKPLSARNLAVILSKYAPQSSDQQEAKEPSPFEELVEALGEEKALRLKERVLSELDQGLATLKQDPWKPENPALAHKLAGSAAMLGLTQIRHLLLKFEAEGETMSRADLEETISQIRDLAKLS